MEDKRGQLKRVSSNSESRDKLAIAEAAITEYVN